MEVAEAVWIRLMMAYEVDAGVVSVFASSTSQGLLSGSDESNGSQVDLHINQLCFVFGNRSGLDLHEWLLSISNMLLKNSIQLLFFDMEKSHVLGPPLFIITRCPFLITPQCLTPAVDPPYRASLCTPL